jgi:hypothetical protein
VDRHSTVSILFQLHSILFFTHLHPLIHTNQRRSQDHTPREAHVPQLEPHRLGLQRHMRERRVDDAFYNAVGWRFGGADAREERVEVVRGEVAKVVAED